MAKRKGATRESRKKAVTKATHSAACAETVDRVMRYNIDRVVSRYANDHDLSLEDAREHERELKRYFALVIDNPGTVYGMCGPVDELWHTFLTFTLLYEEFCRTVAGRFLHHFPNDRAGERSEGSDENYQRFVRDYSATFGEQPPRHLWPAAMETAGGVAVCSTCRCCIAIAEDE